MSRKIMFIIISAALTITINGQSIQGKSALLVIDIQDFYFPGGDIPLYQPEDAAKNAALLIGKFRNNGDEVIFIKHNYEPGGMINNAVKPVEGEKIFSKDNVNSFLDTGLQEYLEGKEISQLVICGMQTHMCVEAAVRAASDLEYDCTLIHDACTSRDLRYNNYIIKAADVHLSTLSSLLSYAKIISTSEYLKQ